MIPKTLYTVALALTLPVVVISTPSAQQNQRKQANAASNQQLSQQEKDFINKAAIANMAEIQAGNIAIQKGTSPELKEYGRLLVHDHQGNLVNLQALASSNDISLPTQVDSEHQKQISQLSSLSGTQFDQKFTQQMVMDHQKTIQQFKNMAANGQTLQVKKYAADSLPVLQKHLEKAQQLELKSRTTSDSKSRQGSKPGTTTHD